MIAGRWRIRIEAFFDGELPDDAAEALVDALHDAGFTLEGASFQPPRAPKPRRGPFRLIPLLNRTPKSKGDTA